MNEVPEDGTLPIAEAVSLAVQLHRQGRRAEAGEIYRAVLEVSPDHADVLSFLGILSDQEGRSAEAERLLRKATELVPGHLPYRSNLGTVLKGMGRLEEAEEAFRQVLSADPENADALNNLGVVLKSQGRLEEAAEVLKAAASRSPGGFGPHLNLGNVLRRLGRTKEALAAHLEAVALNPNLTDAPKLRIYALHATGRKAEAVRLLDEWLAAAPDDPMARHLRAAVSGEDVPERASDQFVAETFDRFASHFDSLLQHLGYRAPELLLDAVASELPPPKGDLQVADLGCGTGLCGPLLRPYARRLVGVDLSEGMVEKARQRGVYDELTIGELTEFLRLRNGEYDVVVSADTFCYFGALENAFIAAGRALRDGGFFAVTLEKTESSRAPQGFSLEHHGRYRHTEAYVRSCLAGGGMEVLSVAVATLRTEAAEPVEGFVVVARKMPA